MSDIQICNSALRQVGGSPITSFLDNTEEAEYCAEFYPELRDYMLADYRWTFARSRVALAKLLEVPPFGYSTKFQLPPDFLALLEVVPSGMDYSIEGRELLCDEGDVSILYIKRIEDTSLFSEHFKQALILGLVHRLRYAITKQLAKTREDFEIFQGALEYAKSQDSQLDIGSSLKSNTLLSVRY